MSLPRGLEHVTNFARVVDDLTDPEALEVAFGRAVRAMGYHGFDAWVVTRGSFGNLLQNQNLWAADYAPELIKAFIREGLIETCPVTEHAAKTSEPFDYVAMLKRCQPNASVNFQKATLKVFNVHQAWIVPLNTIDQMRGVTLYLKGKSAAVRRHFAETRMAAQLISSDFMAGFVRVNRPKPATPPPSLEVTLSAREVDCMSWIAKGKTNWEISQILEISENTVRYHLKNAFRKLDANSRSSAVMRAAQAGLITL